MHSLIFQVRIYVDAVVNHMCGSTGGTGTHSTCGSYFNTGNREFPAVPYSAWDFNDGKCQTGSGDIENYGDIYQVRDCKLSSLLDLALEKDYVRTKVAEYMNNLIDMGVAGFRIDAAKHTWPGDIRAFLDKLHNLNTRYMNVNLQTGLPAGTYCDVISGQKEGNACTGKQVYVSSDGMANFQISNSDEDPFVAIHVNDKLYMNVDLQTGLPAGTYCDVISGQKEGNACTGKQVYVSSDGMANFQISNSDEDPFVAIHVNDKLNMVVFRNVVDGQPFSNWWDNGSNQVAFGRGNKGFIVFNNDDWYMNVNLQTGLPAGTYCDVISGQKEGNACTGKQVYVSSDGMANFQISNSDEDPFVAIHVNDKL
ncbi:UNVERIFIED_CONTAM: hypothetical protein H355_004430 [Colinus virginianus]|nr:hypothetical protein H355_004430 [Colinus virginianus]